MDEDKINRILGLTNTTQGQFSPGGKPRNLPTPKQVEEKEVSDFIKRNMRVGIPLEASEEIPFDARFGATRRSTPEQQLGFLNSYFRDRYPYFYKEPPARLSDTGEIIVRVPTPEGAKDVMMNARGMTLEDWSALGAYGEEAAMAAMSVFLGKKLPPASTMGKIAARFPKSAASVEASAGASLGGAGRDVALEAMDQGKVDVQEIAARRAKEFLLGLGIDVGIGAGNAIGKRVLAPFATKLQPVHQEMKDASEYLETKYGTPYTRTPGQITGNPLLQRTEASMEVMPGSAKIMEKTKQKNVQEIHDIQTAILGAKRDALPTEEEVAQAALAELETQVKPLVETEAQKTLRVVNIANRRLGEALDKATGVQMQVKPERVGAGMRSRVQAEYEVLQDEAQRRYGALEMLPGGSDRILTAPNLQKRANDLLDRLASVETTKQVPTGVLGPTGQPIMAQQQVVERLKEYLPEGVDAMLVRIAELDPSAKFSLRDLIRARGGLDNKISKEAANIPSKRLRELNEVRSMLDDSIKDAVDSIPDKRLKGLYESTNEWYAQERSRFDDITIKKMFADFDKGGGIRDEDIIRNIGLSEYGVWKKFLGADSSEFKMLRRSIADSVINAATPVGSETVSGKALLNELTEFYKHKRSIAEDVFGKKGGSFSTQLQQLGEVLSNSEAKLDAKQLGAALQGDRPLAQAVRELAQAQTKLNRAYKSDILKKIGEGKLGSTDLDPGRFIDLVFDTASPKEIEAVVGQLSGKPELVTQLRQKAIERVFFQSQRAAKAIDPARLGPGDAFRPPSSISMEQIFGSEANQARLRALLGNDTMKDLQEFAKLMRGAEANDQMFKTAAALSSGALVQGMVRRGPLPYMGEWVKQKFAAMMLTWPGLRKIAGMRPEDYSDDLAIQLMAVEPFFQKSIEDGGTNIKDWWNEVHKGQQRQVDAKEQKINRILAP